MQKKSKLNMILLVIIIILLVSALGYLLFINSKKEVKSEENKNITTNTVVVPSDWKTYTNTSVGFEFKYPPEIIVDLDPSHGVGTVGFRGLVNPPSGLITPQSIDDSANADVNHSIDGTSIISSVNVGGQDARIVCNPDDGKCSANIVLPKPFKLGKADDGSDRYFKFLVIGNPFFPQKDVNQILSTFKFTN